MKEEASDYLELETIKNLVKKYSQFINFPIYLWSSKVSVSTKDSRPSSFKFTNSWRTSWTHRFCHFQTETVEEPIEEEAEAEKEEAAEDEAEVEEEDEDKDKPKTKKVLNLAA